MCVKLVYLFQSESMCFFNHLTDLTASTFLFSTSSSTSMRLESFVSDEASAGFGAGFRVKKDLEKLGNKSVMNIIWVFHGFVIKL